MKGKLIVIEGLDGSGKATQTALLYESLKPLCNIKKISFPSYDQPSSALVKMYLNSEFGDDPSIVNAYAASSFFAVDRYASYMKFWKEDYLNGEVIISDRYSTSNMVFHMPKLAPDHWDEYLIWAEDYEYNKLSLPKPDLVIYLDLPIEISQEFMSLRYNGDENKKDLHEKNTAYLKSCRNSALYAAKKNKWKIINCLENGSIKTIDKVHDEIFDIVKREIL